MRQENSLRVAEQCYLPIALPEVRGNQDYKNFKALLEQIDSLLSKAHIEIQLQEYFLTKAQTSSQKERKKGLSEKECLKIQQYISTALRCNVSRVLVGESFRKFAIHLADSNLLQRFCRLVSFDEVWAPSKSTLQEYSEVFNEAQIREVSQVLSQAVGNSEAGKALGLHEALDLSVALLDSTCIKLNIHFSVDWVLLRDAIRTLSKAIECIRRHGLKHRIKDPKEFRTEINRYCIAMTQAKKGKRARRKQRATLRLMKKLSGCVKNHAERYRNLLIEKREETDLSEKEAAQIIKRIDNVLLQLPQAIKQAHERVIGGRLVPNEDKILSIYEPQTQVYHRGKVGQATEFGLQLHLAESMDGFIMDWDLVEGAPKQDSKHLKPCLQRLQESDIHVKYVVGDRAYPSKDNRTYLKEQDIQDHLCPRNLVKLQEKLKEKAFAKFQKRRAQTEARVGIIKNNFIGLKMSMKGIVRQKKHAAWCVLTHNLWVVARLILAQEERLEAAA